VSPKHRRRGPGEGSINKVRLQSGKTAYRAYLTVGYKVDEDGKKLPVRRTVQRRTFQATSDALARLRDKYRVDLDFKAEAEMHLSTLFDKWLDHFIATYKPKGRTPGTYRWAIGHARAQLGDPLAAHVTGLQLQEALNQLGHRLAPKSLNLVRVVLDGAFSQAVLWRIRTDNPASELKLPRERHDSPEPERRVITAEQGSAYLGALQSERLGLAVALTYAIGIRPGEAAALRIEDIDLDALTITVRGAHNVVGKTVEREAPKSRRGLRTLPLPVELAPWVRQRITRVQNERAAMGDRWPAPDEGLLFVRETDGGRLSNHQIYQVARRVAERAGLGAIGPRVLRRSMLSLLARAGVDPKVRAAIGGHTTEVTEKHYREVDPSEVGAAMGRMASLLPSLPGPTPDEDAN
jgi:integrase